MADDNPELAALIKGVQSGSAFVLITEDGMLGTFPTEQINSVIALALIARCGMDRERAIRTLKDADREHRAFAAQHPELKPN